MTPENTMEIRARPAEGGLDSSSLNDFNYAWGALAGRDAIDFAMTSEGTDIKAVKWVGNGAVGIPKQRSPGWRPFRMERDQPQDSAK